MAHIPQKNILSFFNFFHMSGSLYYHIPTASLWKIEGSSLSELLRDISKIYEDERLPAKNIQTNIRYAEEIYIDKLTFILTTGCNLACKYCYTNDIYKTKSHELMSKKTARIALQKIRKLSNKSFRFIQFFGGEPLFNIDTMKYIISHLKQNNFKYVKYILNTNGTLIDTDTAQFLAENIDLIYISLDGPKRINDLNRVFLNGEGTYEIVVKGLKEILNKPRKGKIIAEVTYTHKHIESKVSMVDVWTHIKSLGFDDVYIVWEFSLKNSKEYYAHIFTQMKELMKYLGQNNKEAQSLNEWRGLLSANLISPWPCMAGIDTLTVDPRGDVFPCYWLMYPNFNMGNILKNFPDEKFWSIRESLLNNTKSESKKCHSCWLRYTCKQCLGKRYLIKGDISAPYDEECKIIKSISKYYSHFIEG